jgi:hypothetical protein
VTFFRQGKNEKGWKFGSDIESSTASFLTRLVLSNRFDGGLEMLTEICPALQELDMPQILVSRILIAAASTVPVERLNGLVVGYLQYLPGGSATVLSQTGAGTSLRRKGAIEIGAPASRRSLPKNIKKVIGEILRLHL